MKALAVLLALMSFGAIAQTRVISIDAFDLAYSGGIVFKHDNGKRNDRDETNFRLNLNYAQNFAEYVGLMWKAQINMNRTDVDFGGSDRFESTYGVSAGVLYNFQPEDMKNSFMAGGGVGIERATYDIAGRDDQSGFNVLMQFEGGKRFDLGQYMASNLTYAPSISVIFKRYGGDIRDDYYRSGNEVRLNFLKFDVVF